MSNDFSNMQGSSDGPGSSGLQDRVTSELGDLSQKAKEDFDAAKTRADHDIEELGHQARDKMGEATAKVRSFAEEQKGLAANQISGVAEAIGKVADELEGSEQQAIARYARDLAQGLSKIGKQLKQRDTDDLVGAAESFGRSQPVAFLGAAALAGFVASRFALASAHRRAGKLTPQTNPPYPANSDTASGHERGDLQ